MNVWPATLQQVVNEGGFNMDFGDTTVATEMDVGARKIRQRYTFGIDKIQGNIDMKKDLYPTLETFYKTTCAGGSLPFTMTHPVTLSSATFRFTAPPKISRLGGEYYSVSLSLEVVG